MTRARAQEIIKNYVPHKGFFDLSSKPQEINDVEYATILDTQNLLARQNEAFKDKEVMKNNQHTWEQLKALSAKLQLAIFQYWNIWELN